MKRLLPIAALLAFLLAGCNHVIFFSKKPKAHKTAQSKLISTDVELDFRQRWTDKRTSDLVAQGMLPDTARAQALAEFRVEFSYTHAAQMP